MSRCPKCGSTTKDTCATHGCPTTPEERANMDNLGPPRHGMSVGFGQVAKQIEFLRTEARQRGRHLATLQKRHDYLTRRIETCPGDSTYHYMMQERAALRWVMDQVGSTK